MTYNGQDKVNSPQNRTRPEGDEIFTISHKNPKRLISQGSVISGADFEKAITETGYGKFNYLLLMLAVPASCASTFDTTALSYALPTATCDLKLTSYDRGMLNGIIYAGMIASAFFWGYVADKFGRQKTLAFGYFGDAVVGIAASCSQNFWTLLVFKFLSGVMICGSFSIILTYLSEMVNAKYRDTTILMVGFFQSLGLIVQALLAWAIIPLSVKWTILGGSVVFNSWRLFLLVSTVPSILAGIGSSFCFESPKFLLAKGHKEEALKVFQSIYSYNTGKPENTYSVTKLKMDPDEGNGSAKASFWQQATGLFRPPHLYKAVVISLIQCGCLTTLNGIRLWLPQLFFYIKQMPEGESLTTCEIIGKNHTSSSSADCDHFVVDTSVYTNMLFVSALITISFIISLIVVRKVGKRNMLVSLFIMQTAVVSGLGWVRPPFTIPLAGVFIAFANTTTIGLVGFVVQMFPTSLRTMAVSLTMMFARMGVVVGNISLPFCLSLSCTGTFVEVGGITLLCGVALYLLAVSAARSERNKTQTQTNGQNS